MIALDTNLLVYALGTRARHHLAAIAAIERAASQPGGWGIALPVVAEYWSIVTHSAFMGVRVSESAAHDFLHELVTRSGANILLAREGFATRLADRAMRQGVSGRRIFDLQIALVAAESGATELWTHDRDFVALPGLRLVDPLAT